MEGRKHKNKHNHHSNNHLSLPQHDTHDLHTIYKLRLSMKKRLSPQSLDTPSPQGSKELKDMLQRLVEIDTESRDLLTKVFSMLEKDEKLENYFKKRIEDPKVSRMWELVEHVLACQEELPSLDELAINNDYHACIKLNCGVNKDISDRDEEDEELRLERFRIKTLDSTSTSVGGGVSVKELKTSVVHGKVIGK